MEKTQVYFTSTVKGKETSNRGGMAIVGLKAYWVGRPCIKGSMVQQSVPIGHDQIKGKSEIATR